ncbi:MAG TPA: DUF2779 domain-containing protein [Spirochaetia bacterium]|nr:DUF2779 domain-containing protein [Spirochaetia bacterium]
MTNAVKYRYLTKSRFALALECETKLFYTGKPEYPDRKREDSFLTALAEGGFQVGEMAKLYYPGGSEIETLDHHQALEETNALLRPNSVILYEAAVTFENLFIRTDILIKNGSTLELVEVKSKSFGGTDSRDFLDSQGRIESDWFPYLYDVAFQMHVLTRAFPNMRVRSCLLLAEKGAKASVDGLNQRFLIYRDRNGRTRIRVRKGTTKKSLGRPILIRVPVDDIVARIHDGTDGQDIPEPFPGWVARLAERYRRDEKITTPIGRKCSDCEFTCTPEDERRGLKSGFKECWRQQAGLRDEEFGEPLVIHLWNCRHKDSFLNRGLYFLRDLEEEHVSPKTGATKGKMKGLSVSERQWMQVQKARTGDPAPYFDAKGIRAEMEHWVYPLHFVDFETTAMAIPFNRGRSPYEGVAFQFSHHRVEESGKIAHAGQYLDRNRGRFPSFDFLRALKAELEGDEGTIFRYGAHENTYLNIIYRQLREPGSAGIPDRGDLCRWIASVARPTKRNKNAWQPGRRETVDLLALLKRYFYHPLTCGSNSLKDVLPAILSTSSYLRSKYSRPVYGKGLEMGSSNFENWTWIRFDEGGSPVDPYRLLPPVFEETGNGGIDSLDRLITDSNLSDGGAAMVAYARMQFSEMSDKERHALEQALLKYCELDTLAMVMLWEYWTRELLIG